MERRNKTWSCTRGINTIGVWCPWCYENRKGRASHRGHAHYHAKLIPKATYQEFQVRRPTPATRPKKGEFLCPDKSFQATYPELAKGLCDPFWDDGKPRKTWTLKVHMDEDAVHITLNDPDSKLVCFTTASELIEGLAAIEEALQGPGLSWRKSKY